MDRPTLSLLNAALGYAGLKWLVFPLHEAINGRCSCAKPNCSSPGKHPRTAHGLKDATIDETIIRALWNRWPTANIGIKTGPKSGIIMIGPDGEQGIKDFKKLRDHFGEIPDGPIAESGSGGKHYIFQHPGIKITTRSNLNNTKIDVRGDGGYFVAAPSVNKNGPYRWIVSPFDIAVPKMPAWLIDWSEKSSRKSTELTATTSKSSVKEAAGTDQTTVLARAKRYLAKIPEAIEGKGGDPQTYSAAVAMVYGFNLGVSAGFKLLREEYNPRCVPQWDEKELFRKCERANTEPHDKPRGFLLDKLFVPNSTSGLDLELQNTQ